VLETPNANLVDGMRWLLSAYTIRLKMLELMEGNLGDDHSGRLDRETPPQKPERILAGTKPTCPRGSKMTPPDSASQSACAARRCRQLGGSLLGCTWARSKAPAPIYTNGAKQETTNRSSCPTPVPTYG
jgi:hypothetical protein